MEIQNKNLDLSAGFQKKLILISSFTINFHYKCNNFPFSLRGRVQSDRTHLSLGFVLNWRKSQESMKAKLNRLLISNSLKIWFVIEYTDFIIRVLDPKSKFFSLENYYFCLSIVMLKRHFSARNINSCYLSLEYEYLWFLIYHTIFFNCV